MVIVQLLHHSDQRFFGCLRDTNVQSVRFLTSWVLHYAMNFQTVFLVFHPGLQCHSLYCPTILINVRLFWCLLQKSWHQLSAVQRILSASLWKVFFDTRRWKGHFYTCQKVWIIVWSYKLRFCPTFSLSQHKVKFPTASDAVVFYMKWEKYLHGSDRIQCI